MVGHETKRQQLERVIGMDMQEGTFQFEHVFLGPENRLPVVAAHDDVIISLGVKRALSGHGSPHQRTVRMRSADFPFERFINCRFRYFFVA